VRERFNVKTLLPPAGIIGADRALSMTPHALTLIADIGKNIAALICAGCASTSRQTDRIDLNFELRRLVIRAMTPSDVSGC